jgi:RNA polymerase sigma-70 factor (ECF subfamily)
MRQLENWLDQIKSGDESAFVDLQQHFEAELRRFMYRLIGAHELEDDLIQNTFIAFYHNIERLSAETVRPFLFRVLRNQCYDELRRQGRYQHVSLNNDLAPNSPIIINTEPPPDEVIYWRMAYADVQRAMDNLPDPQRQVLILYAEHGFAYEEIAEALNISIGTVKSRLHHAKKNLRRLVDPHVLDELDNN